MKSNDHDVVQGEEEKKRTEGKGFTLLQCIWAIYSHLTRIHFRVLAGFTGLPLRCFLFSFYYKESDNSNCISDCLNNLHILTTSVSSYYSILCTFLTLIFKEKFEVYKKKEKKTFTPSGIIGSLCIE